MPTTIFVSLPVKDPQKSVAFYEALGYKANPQFSDPTGGSGCINISDTISVMFTTEEQFQKISPKPLSDATKYCQVLLSLTCDSREEVDTLVKNAVAAGGSQAHEPEDYGFMYQSGFYDLDGHGWGLTWVNPEQAS
jgi:predicted lactoylglutathione lyase